MANSVAPYGFRYVANLAGGGAVLQTMTHAAADNVAIGKGDFVTPTGAARTVEQYDNNDPVWGLALGYVALSTLGTMSVVHLNHTSILEAQEDSTGGNIAAASEQLNVPVTVAAASTTTGLSQMSIDSSNVATTATLALRLLRPSGRIGNVVAEAGCHWLVSPLELDIAEGKAGV